MAGDDRFELGVVVELFAGEVGQVNSFAEDVFFIVVLGETKIWLQFVDGNCLLFLLGVLLLLFFDGFLLAEFIDEVGGDEEGEVVHQGGVDHLDGQFGTEIEQKIMLFFNLFNLFHEDGSEIVNRDGSFGNC